MSSSSSAKIRASLATDGERVDALYDEATSATAATRSAATKRTATRTSHNASSEDASTSAIKQMTKSKMKPFLTQREGLNLDDNKAYKMPTAADSMDEQLFKGSLNSAATPPFHSQATCSDRVHGADSRCCSTADRPAKPTPQGLPLARASSDTALLQIRRSESSACEAGTEWCRWWCS